MTLPEARRLFSLAHTALLGARRELAAAENAATVDQARLAEFRRLLRSAESNFRERRRELEALEGQEARA